MKITKEDITPEKMETDTQLIKNSSIVKISCGNSIT
jgi:hypothetical protein